MNSPADQETRERALAPDRSFIVQAPAGSGKTELLIRRFLVLLGQVETPEEIVAITFTRKAAAEMRERVLKALADSEKRCPQDPYERELWEISRLAWRNNQQRNWRVEQYPARLRIQTIDALCAALTRRMPWLSGFGAPLRVVEDATELYREAATETLRLIDTGRKDWRESVSVLLTHLDNQVYRAVELLTDMLRFRDQWLRYLGPGSSADETRRREALEGAWRRTVNKELAQVFQMVPESLKQDMLECAVYAAGNLRADGKSGPIASWDSTQRFIDASAEQLELWQGLRELLLTGSGEWRRQVNVRIGFPPGKVGRAPEMKARMNDLLRFLSGFEEFRNSLHRVGRLPDVSFDENQWVVLAALTTLLPLAAAQLNVLFSERGESDFTEITMRANLALGSIESPSDLALRMDHQISHLLIDEFQDTSFSHFQLAHSLTAGWTDDDGRTLFLVGDPMQSIYRFREAEVGLFLQVQDHGIGNLKPIPLTLSANFRSDPAVVDWVNETFAACFPSRPDLGRGAVTYSASKAHVTPRSGAGVFFHPFRDVGEEQEASFVIDLVKEIRGRRPKESMAILVRSRQALRAILPALERAGIDYAGLDIERLSWQPAVQDLLSLTRALASPADRVAWLSILRAPWCGLSLRDLFHLAGEPENVCVWDRLTDDEVLGRLSTDGRRRVRRVMDALGQAMAYRGRGGLRRLVESTWLSLGGPACATIVEHANARTYFGLLDEYEGAHDAGDFQDLFRMVEERWSHADESPDHRLQIMTIHKAKGLEFDTVIIPGLQRQHRPEDSKLLLWEEAIRDQGLLLMAPLAEIGGAGDPHYDYLRSLQAEKEYFETLRLLYVGCTRARRALHLSSIASTKRDGSLRRPVAQSMLAPLWEVIEPEFARARTQQFDLFERVAGGASGGLRRLPHDWRAPDYPTPVHVDSVDAETEPVEQPVEFSWAGETARQIGIIVHEVMERMANDGLKPWSVDRIAALQASWERRLIHQGIDPPAAKSAAMRVKNALRNIVSDDRARWLLSSDHTEAANEFAVTMWHEGVLRNFRIDRTFVDAEGVRWVVDFKSSAHEGGDIDGFLDRELTRYQPQLHRYAAAMRCLEDRPVRLGLYFPLLKGWREWDYEV